MQLAFAREVKVVVNESFLIVAESYELEGQSQEGFHRSQDWVAKKTSSNIR